MVENAPQARPQAGLDKACIVYEAPAEGGITRLMALYLHADADIIGPVRSARPYFIRWSMEYRAVFAHCGESVDASRFFAYYDPPAINEIPNPHPFWRSSQRQPPHNLYTSTARLWDEVAAKGWVASLGRSQHRFAKAEDEPGGTSASASEAQATVMLPHKVVIRYPTGHLLTWEYDARIKAFVRSMDGKPHSDAVSGGRIAAVSLIIQDVQSAPTGDLLETIELSDVGSGPATILSATGTGGRGVQTVGTWTKQLDTAPTEFRDALGRSVRLRPGQLWVEVVPQDAEVKLVAAAPPAGAKAQSAGGDISGL